MQPPTTEAAADVAAAPPTRTVPTEKPNPSLLEDDADADIGEQEEEDEDDEEDDEDDEQDAREATADDQDEDGDGSGEAYAGDDVDEDAEFDSVAKPMKASDSQQALTTVEVDEEEPTDELDSDLVDVLHDMDADSTTSSRIKDAIIKFHALLLTSRNNEKRLIGKIRGLTRELNQSVASVAQAMKVSHIDRSQVVSLKKEVKKAWKLVEQSNEKEVRNRQMIEALKDEVSTLGKKAANKPLQQGTDAGLLELLQMPQSKDELQREVDKRNERIADLERTLELADDKNARMRVEMEVAIEEMNGLKDMISVKRDEAEKDNRLRERLERDLRDTRATVDTKNLELRNKVDQTVKQSDEIRRLENQLKDALLARDQMKQEADALAHMRSKLEQEYDRQLNAASALESENQQLISDVKLAGDDVTKLREDMKVIVRMRDTMQKKLKLVEEIKHDAEVERDSLKSSHHSLEREVGIHRKQAEADKKQIEDLVRERDILSKNYLKASAATQKQANLVKLHEQTKRNLEQEISGYKDEASKQRKIIFALEKERDRYINDASQQQALRVAAEEEAKIMDNQIFDCKKKIAEAEHKLKQQQARPFSLYEQVRSDRNLYSKNLIESQDEITETKRKLKIMSHQIEQYKEEISAKEGALLKEHFERLKVEKEREGVKGELQKLKQQLEANHQFIQSQQAEERKLQHIIAEADAERLRQKKEYESVIQERDILGTQLIRRNDELALLYEKIKIQQSTLNKGEVQYRERLEDIRVLKLEIKKLRREKTILQHETTNVDALRNELYRLQKELLGERTRVKVLEEELENPMNIHRWRKLSGSDPNTYELVQKIQALQRRLIGKTEQVVEKELLLQAKEKLYQELKSMLSRVPGPEVVEQAESFKTALREKTREMKAMASELNMYHTQVHDYKQEIERLNRQVQEAKKKYFDVKKRSLRNREKAEAPVSGRSNKDLSMESPLQTAAKYLKANAAQSRLDTLRSQQQQYTFASVPSGGGQFPMKTPATSSMTRLNRTQSAPKVSTNADNEFASHAQGVDSQLPIIGDRPAVAQDAP
ncbi:Cilia- and flagella-associated protein 58 [Sorochytrium milnesiophthora]